MAENTLSALIKALKREPASPARQAGDRPDADYDDEDDDTPKRKPKGKRDELGDDLTVVPPEPLG